MWAGIRVADTLFLPPTSSTWHNICICLEWSSYLAPSQGWASKSFTRSLDNVLFPLIPSVHRNVLCIMYTRSRVWVGCGWKDWALWPLPLRCAAAHGRRDGSRWRCSQVHWAGMYSLLLMVFESYWPLNDKHDWTCQTDLWWEKRITRAEQNKPSWRPEDVRQTALFESWKTKASSLCKIKFFASSAEELNIDKAVQNKHALKSESPC